MPYKNRTNLQKWFVNIYLFIVFPLIYSGFITPEDLGTLLKSLGQNPTDEQMEELMKVSLQNYVLEIGI